MEPDISGVGPGVDDLIEDQGTGTPAFRGRAKTATRLFATVEALSKIRDLSRQVTMNTVPLLSRGFDALNRATERVAKNLADIEAKVIGLEGSAGGVGAALGSSIKFSSTLKDPDGGPREDSGDSSGSGSGSGGGGAQTPNGGGATFNGQPSARSIVQQIFEDPLVQAGAVVRFAQRHVSSTFGGRAAADLLYNRLSYGDTLAYEAGLPGARRDVNVPASRQDREQIRRALIFDNDLARGALDLEDLATGLDYLRTTTGAITTHQLADVGRTASLFAQLQPGIGIQGGAEATAQFWSGRTAQQLRALGIELDFRNQDPTQVANAFRQIRDRLGLDDPERLRYAFMKGTPINQTLEMLLGDTQGTLAQSFLSFTQAELTQGPIDVTDPAAIRKTGLSDNLLTSELEQRESEIQRDAEFENELNFAAETFNNAARIFNEAVGRFVGLPIVEWLAGFGLQGLADLGNFGLGLWGLSRIPGVGGLIGRAAGAVRGAVGSAWRGITGGGGRAAGGASGARAVAGAAGRGASWIWRAAGPLTGVTASNQRLTSEDLIEWGIDPNSDFIQTIREHEEGVGDPALDIGDPEPDIQGLEGLHPAMAQNVRRMMADNPRLVINSAFRSANEQAALYASGRTPAPPGMSRHEQGTAIDIGPPSEWGWLQANASKYGLESITDSEPWHYELAGSRSVYSKWASRQNERGGGSGYAVGKGAPIPPHLYDSTTIPGMVRYLESTGVGARLVSAYRVGSTTYHGKAQATDWGPPDGRTTEGYNNPGLFKIFWAFAKVGHKLRELILTGAPFWILSGQKREPYTGRLWNTHKDHVHVATTEKDLGAGTFDLPGYPGAPGSGSGSSGGSLALGGFMDMASLGSREEIEVWQSLLSGGGSTAATNDYNESSTGRAQGGIGVGAVEDGSIPGTIINVARRLGATPKDLLAAFEAGLVESNMRNLRYGDRDSLGVFQQRPSMGWGTPEQIMNVAFAAESFFEGRGTNQGAMDYNRGGSWRGTAGQLAQKVQRSAYPARYDERRSEAVELAAQYGIDLSHVSDPHPDILDMTVSTPTPTQIASEVPTFNSAMQQAPVVRTSTLGGRGMYQSPQGGGSTLVIHKVELSVNLADGSPEQVDRLFENIRKKAQQHMAINELTMR